MTKKYKNKLVPYCLGLSLLVAGNAYASIELGNTGIKFNGGAKVVNTISSAEEYAFGKGDKAGRYLGQNTYFRADLYFSGEHDLEIWNNTKAIWQWDSRAYTTDTTFDATRVAFVGLKGNFGTIKIGKFYTPMDNVHTYGTYVDKYNQAFEYSIPTDLVKGLEFTTVVAFDPNGAKTGSYQIDTGDKNSTNAVEDKKKNARAPWGVDTGVKYTHADSGFSAYVGYAQTDNLDGASALNLDKDKKFTGNTVSNTLKTAAVEVGYKKNGLNVVVGYRDVYSKSKDKQEKTNLVETKSKQNYALSLDINYTKDKHFVAFAFDTQPKTTTKQKVGLDIYYNYKLTKNLSASVEVEHIFTNTGSGDNKTDFIKGSSTAMTTSLKYYF